MAESDRKLWQLPHPAGPTERLSTASSLPSITGDGEEGGGEGSWPPGSRSGASPPFERDRAFAVDWRSRCYELESTLRNFRVQAARVRDILKEKLAEMEENVWRAQIKAEKAEKKAQLMEQRFLELEVRSGGSSSILPSPNKSFNFKDLDNNHKDSVILSLEGQVQEQKRLRISDAKQVEDKATKIKEWVANKLKELEDQNLHLREQNQKCNVQLELLKGRLNQVSKLSPKPRQKQVIDRASTEDSSRGSFEDHGESDDSLPPPELNPTNLSPSLAMRRIHRDHSLGDAEDLFDCCSPPLPQEPDQHPASPSPLYATVDYSSKAKQSVTQQIYSAAPPRVKLERKKYAVEGPITPSTLSTASDPRLSEVDCSSWHRGSSRVDSGSADVDTPNSPRSPESPDHSYLKLSSDNMDHLGSYSQRKSLPPPVIQDDIIPNSCIDAAGQSNCAQDHGSDARTSSSASRGCRPLTAPTTIVSQLDEAECLECVNRRAMPDKAFLTLDDLSSTLSLYKETIDDEDQIHDYAEIYTPNKERSEFQLNVEECVAPVDTSGATRGPPTPPLHRFPSWESRIYEIALSGINISSENTAKPITDSSNNNQNKMPSFETRCTNAAFTELNIPVYATVKGRASQIRSVPFTGESSDSSDNEDTRVTTFTTSSHTTSGDTESSASVGAGGGSESPRDKKITISPRLSTAPTPPPHATPVLMRSHVITNSPMKVCREVSTESVLSDDYAVPPDAVSVDGYSLSTLDQHSSLTNTPSLYRRTPNVEDTPKKEPLEKSGYLTKLGGKFKTWRRRWFVLRNGTLCYYKSQNDANRKPQGQIILDNVCRVNRAEGAATFEVSTGKRTYYFTADSINMMEEWIKVLQNVLRQNATRLLLSKEDHKPAAEGWLTKVKHGHSRRCWCVLIGRLFLYFKTPNDPTPLGQINMRDARVEEVGHVSDSDDEDHDDNHLNKSEYTVGIFPNHQGPTYLLMDNKQQMDTWMYHLTVVSSGDNLVGTQYEQLIAKLMEVDGEENCVVWRHPLLLYSKDSITQPLTTLPSEQLQSEAIKLFKSLQLFISVPSDTSGIDYHVALAQNALHQCLLFPELQNELFCQLIKQTSRHCHHKVGVQQLLISATQSLFLCDTSSSEKSSPSSIGSLDKPMPSESKLNPAPFVFVQAWQLLALAVSLFVPKNRTLWYLRTHLERNVNSKLEAGKYAIFCQRALERALSKGARECKPSRMEVLSILLKNPYHHSLPHSIPVHFVNGAYQVFGFDGSTTVHEFTETVNTEVGIRESETSGFSLFSDDPIEKDLEHCLHKTAKLCDVISQWEQALREKHLGKFENTKVLKLLYKSRLILRHNIKSETEKERLLIVYQINEEMMLNRFPISKELALELAALLAQIEFGDLSSELSRGNDTKPQLQMLQVIDRFFPKRFREPGSDKRLQELLKEKWIALRGCGSFNCVRIYLNCARKWSYCGGRLFPAKFKSGELQSVWLAVTENCIAVLDSFTMQCTIRYPYSEVMTFGGCREDFMLVVSSQDSTLNRECDSTKRLLFAMAKPKILELTLLIADYMNAIIQAETAGKLGTSAVPLSPRGSSSTTCHPEKIRSKIRANNVASQSSNTTSGSIPLDSTSPLVPVKVSTLS